MLDVICGLVNFSFVNVHQKRCNDLLFGIDCVFFFCNFLTPSSNPCSKKIGAL